MWKTKTQYVSSCAYMQNREAPVCKEAQRSPSCHQRGTWAISLVHGPLNVTTYITVSLKRSVSLSLFLPALAQGTLYPHPGPPPFILPLRWRKDRFPASLYQGIRVAGATCEFPEAPKGQKAGQRWLQSTWALQPEGIEVWIASALLDSFATEVKVLSVPQCFCPERGLTNVNTCLVGLQGGANGRGDYWTLKKIFFSLKIIRV